jgi:4-hydroxy-4-methyl-2-oxoglutarate aldolase
MTQPLRDQIIQRIRRNRISSTQVADCLDKSGAVESVKALNLGHHRVGPVYWTYAYNESNWELHDQVREAPEGAIVLTEAFACGQRAIYGELVAKYMILYRQVAALVVRGLLRDGPPLIKERWPIWCEGLTPLGCFNAKNAASLDSAVLTQRRAYYDDSVAVCDDTGVVVIGKAYHTEAFLAKLDWIEEQEDLWFDCIDRLKWDTFETVCLKKYQEVGRDDRGRPLPTSAP